MNEKYADIINLPHHVSSERPHMARGDRAAQFAPYSALSGYEDAVDETARRTDRRIELDEDEKELINQALTRLISAPVGSRAAITFFVPDRKKSGGCYVTATGCIGRVDEIRRELTLEGGRVIPIDEIIKIEETDDESEE